MRFKSGKKPETTGKFTPKLRGPKPEVEHESSAQERPLQEHPLSVQTVEPEDLSKTGSSKPAQRELFEKNIRDGQAQEHHETVAGQHATGSFPGRKRRAG